MPAELRAVLSSEAVQEGSRAESGEQQARVGRGAGGPERLRCTAAHPSHNPAPAPAPSPVPWNGQRK